MFPDFKTSITLKIIIAHYKNIFSSFFFIYLPEFALKIVVLAEFAIAHFYVFAIFVQWRNAVIYEKYLLRVILYLLFHKTK